MNRTVALSVNGSAHTLSVAAYRTLLDVLRNDLHLTGTKEGCGSGECGACTVLLDGKPVNACLVLAVEAQGSQIMTIEGLAESGDLDPLQTAFIDHGAVQCGFCTPGMIMAAKALLQQNPHPTEEEVRLAVHGNLCRCTGYDKIVAAILSKAKQRKATK